MGKKKDKKKTEDCKHQWIPLLGKSGNKTIPTLVQVCLKCGDLRIGKRTIRISRFRLDMGGKPIKNLAAPSVAWDALRKGTRVTTAELPAMTDEKIWKGTDGNVEEVDMPAAGWTPTGNGGTKVAGADCEAALKDPIVATAGLRTLGSGAQQAAAGNHSHTLAYTQAFMDCNSKTTGTTSWVQMATVSIPANAKMVFGYCFGSSDTSLKRGYCRTLYNGVQIASSNGAYYYICPDEYYVNGLGFSANLTVEIYRHVDASKIVYGYEGCYMTM